MINPEWYRAVLRKYEPPVSWRPGDFVRFRLSGLDRMLSAGLLRLSPVSMPFVAGFLQGGGMDPGSPGGKGRSGFPGVPGYRAASSPGGRAGASRPPSSHGEPRWKASAAASGDPTSGLRERNGLARPDVQGSVRPAAWSGNASGRPESPGLTPWHIGTGLSAPKYSIPARRPALPVISQGTVRGEEGPFPVSSGFPAGHAVNMNRPGFVGARRESQRQGEGRAGASPLPRQPAGSGVGGGGDARPPGHSGTLRLKQGDVMRGEGRRAAAGKGPAGRGRGALPETVRISPVTLQMKGGVLPGRQAPGGNDAKKEMYAVGRTSSGSSGGILPLRGKASAGGRVSGDREAVPLFERPVPSTGSPAMAPADRAGAVEAATGRGTFRTAPSCSVRVHQAGPQLRPSAMGIRPRPALLEHVAQRVALGGRVNATSLVLQSRLARGRAGSLASKIPGGSGGDPGGGAGINSEGMRPGGAGGLGPLSPEAASAAGNALDAGTPLVNGPGAHGAAAAFYGQDYPGILLPGPASGAGAPGGVSSGPALLQAKGYASGVRQGAPPSFIFREAAVETPDVPGGVSGRQEASHTGDGGAGARTSSSQASLAEGGGVEQEAESRAGLPGESSPGGVDIERLAGEVYLILERRLEMERESRGL